MAQDDDDGGGGGGGGSGGSAMQSGRVHAQRYAKRVRDSERARERESERARERDPGQLRRQGSQVGVFLTRRHGQEAAAGEAKGRLVELVDGDHVWIGQQVDQARLHPAGPRVVAEDQLQPRRQHVSALCY
eukprot:SAG22_NODE_1414_length_4475_cov_10.897395_1_plen_131_part_00